MSFASAMDMPPGEPLHKKRRKGGIRQRLAEEEEEKPKNSSSELGTSLVERWAWGTMSPQEVQDLAQKCKHDFEKAGAAPPQDIVFLASMGTSGAHKPLGFLECFYSCDEPLFYFISGLCQIWFLFLPPTRSQGKICTRFCCSLPTKPACCPKPSCPTLLSRPLTTSSCK